MSIFDTLLDKFRHPATFVELVLGQTPDDPSLCHCPRPITDLDLNDVDSTDEDWCWVCHRPIPEPD